MCALVPYRMARSRAQSRPSAAAEKTRSALGKNATKAVEILVSLMLDEKQKPELRIKAAESILDRVCGKAGSAGAASAEGYPESIRFEGVLEEWSG